MQKKIEDERKSTDRSIDAIMNTLTEIKTSLARVETKLEERK
jgi:histone deacetylase complex regulatory component SIN3